MRNDTAERVHGRNIVTNASLCGEVLVEMVNIRHHADKVTCPRCQEAVRVYQKARAAAQNFTVLAARS